VLAPRRFCTRIKHLVRARAILQFAHELNKTTHRHAVHVATLGSRKSLCVNDSVRRLTSVGLINERCLDLRRQKSTKAQKQRGGGTPSAAARRSCRCSYASPGMDALFAQGCSSAGRALDVEELVTLVSAAQPPPRSLPVSAVSSGAGRGARCEVH
jgi:hypothetical protein